MVNQQTDMLDRILHKAYTESMQPPTIQGSRAPTQIPADFSPQQATEFAFPNLAPSIPMPQSNIDEFYQDYETNPGKYNLKMFRMLPGMADVLRERGVPEQSIQHMVANGVPQELAAELPNPTSELNFWDKLGQFNLARKVASGIETAFKPLVWVNEHVDQPWVGLWKYLGESFIPGEQTVERNVKQFGLYTGLRKGWQETDLPWYGKMAAEMTNPLWWIPGTVWLKGLSAGSKLALGAETAKTISEALSGVSKVTNAKITGAMKKVPFVRMVFEESPQSLLRNATGRSESMLDNLESLYVKSGYKTADMFDDLIRGETRFGLRDAITNPYQIRMADEILTRKVINKSGEAVDISNTLDLPILRDMARNGTEKEVQLAKETLSANMRKAYSTVYNVKLARGEGMFYDMYAFWRGAVLATPTFITQNFFENTVRSLIYNHSFLPVGSVQEIAKTARTPVMRNQGLNLAQRLRGADTVTEARAMITKEVEELKALEFQSPTARRKMLSLQKELDGLPETTEFLNLTNAMPIDQIIKNSNRNVSQYEKTMMGIFNSTAGRLFKSKKAEELARAAVRFPHSTASYLDSALLLRTYANANAQYINAFKTFTPSLADKIQQIEDKFRQHPEWEAEWGKPFTDQLKQGIISAPTQQDMSDFVLGVMGTDPFPKVKSAIQDGTLPPYVIEKLYGELWRGYILGDRKLAADTIRNARIDIANNSRTNAELISQKLELANKELIKDLPAELHNSMQRIIDKFDLDKRVQTKLADIEKQMLAGLEPMDAHEQAVFWANRHEKMEGMRIVKQTFVSEAAAEAAKIPDPVKAREYLDSIIPKLDAALQLYNEQYEQVHPLFASFTSALTKGRNEREVAAGAAQYIENVSKVLKTPELVNGLRGKQITSKLIWNNYYSATARHFDEVPKLVTRLLGMPESTLPEMQAAKVMENWQRELDNISTLVNQALDTPGKLQQHEQLFNSMFGEITNLYNDNIKSVIESEKMLNKASDFAESRAYMLMGNYAKTRGFDELLRGVFPFFYFPSRSIPFYIRTGMEFPAVPRGLWAYQTNTYEPGTPASLLGYYRTPIEGVYVNPFRYMMGMQILGSEPLAGMGQPQFEQVSTALSMLGFSFNPAINLGTELASRITETVTDGQMSLTRGEPRPILPQIDWARKGLMAATGKFIPEPTQLLMGFESQPAWFQRQIEKSVAAQGFDPAAVFGNKATPEMRQALNNAYREVAEKGLITTVLPVRFRHPEEIRMIQSQSDLLEDFNITKDQQIQAREAGINPIQFLNNLTKRQIMNDHPEWQPWLGLTSPFVSKQEREYWEQTRKFWYEYTELRNQYDSLQLYYTNRAETGIISPAEWRARYSDMQEQKSAAFEQLSKSYPLALIDNARRNRYNEEFKRPLPPVHMEDKAVAAYYAIKAPLDDRTGKPDFIALQHLQDQFLDGMPEDIRNYIEADTARPRLLQDDMEIQWRKERRRLRDWDGVKAQLVNSRPEWKQLLDRMAYARSADPVLYNNLRKSRDYKDYLRTLGNARDELIMRDAELEGLLTKWGIKSGPFKNPETMNWWMQNVVKSPTNY